MENSISTVECMHKDKHILKKGRVEWTLSYLTGIGNIGLSSQFSILIQTNTAVSVSVCVHDLQCIHESPSYILQEEPRSDDAQ